MKKHEFKQNDFIIFDSMEQRVEYMSIAKANGYTLSTAERMDGCTKGFGGLEIRFRENRYFTIWSLGSQTNEHKITPYDFLKLISQYEVGDEVEVLKTGDHGCSAKKGDIVRVKAVGSNDLTLDVKSAPFSHFANVKLHKSISNKQTSTNNQKTTSMKKFKNRFAVTGSVSLIRAMVDELTAIGYKQVNKNPDERNIIVNEYGMVLNNGEFGRYSSTGDDTTVIYYLPQDWDRALAAAKETVEEQKTYQFGGKTRYLRGNASLTETPTGGAGVNISDLKEWYRWFNSMPKTLTSLKCSMPDGHVTLGCTTGTLHEALAICKDLFKY